MTLRPDNTLPKSERLSGKRAIASLMSDGRWGATAHLRYCHLHRDDDLPGRIMVSVPKKFFKRAVKRNLLKRRIREAYRTGERTAAGVDMLISYSCPEVLGFEAVRDEVAAAVSAVNGLYRPSTATDEERSMSETTEQ